MLAAYWRGRAVQEAQLAPGAMAAVGLTWDKAQQLCAKYADVTPACDNAEDNVTVSGSAAEVSRLVADMKPQNVFAKEVNSYGVAFHSPVMQKAAPIYLQALKKVLFRHFIPAFHVHWFACVRVVNIATNEVSFVV